MSASDREPLSLVILSGGSGRTGMRVVQSALAQFEEPAVSIVLKPRVRQVREALKIVTWARDHQAVLCHSLVQPKMREALIRECARQDVRAVDLLGPILTLLEDHLDAPPRNQPGLSYELNKEQFDRIDAVDFTLAHDDGARIDDLKRADLVLVGVSRSSKSVTSFYLAYRGLRVANVPLILGVEPPRELTRLNAKKVIGLVMNPHRLQNIRDARHGAIGAAKLESYANLRDVTAELRYAQTLMRKHRWRSIDVSYKAIEEVATEIVAMCSAR